MICILAGNFKEAERWAYAQNLSRKEWFFPVDENDLMRRSNFHVIVVGTAGENVPASYFEKIYQIARNRGKIGRL